MIYLIILYVSVFGCPYYFTSTFFVFCLPSAVTFKMYTPLARSAFSTCAPARLYTCKRSYSPPTCTFPLLTKMLTLCSASALFTSVGLTKPVCLCDSPRRASQQL